MGIVSIAAFANSTAVAAISGVINININTITIIIIIVVVVVVVVVVAAAAAIANIVVNLHARSRVELIIVACIADFSHTNIGRRITPSSSWTVCHRVCIAIAISINIIITIIIAVVVVKVDNIPSLDPR